MRRRPVIPLFVGSACVAAFVLTGLVAMTSQTALRYDGDMVYGLAALDRPGLHAPIVMAAHLANPLPYAVMGLALVAWAVSQARAARALACLALLVLPAGTAQILKQATATPRIVPQLGFEQVGAASWPSGHATAAMTLALCAVLVAPPAARVAASVVGGLFAAAVGYAVIALEWHFASDVLGGFLLATAWTAFAVAVVRSVEARPPVSLRVEGLGRRLAGGFAAAAGLAAAGVLAVGHETVAEYASRRPSVLVGMLVIGALAALLAAVVAVVAVEA